MMMIMSGLALNPFWKKEKGEEERKKLFRHRVEKSVYVGGVIYYLDKGGGAN